MEVRIRVKLDEKETERFKYLKDLTNSNNNAQLFKKLLRIKI